jgi:hypothetical protein
MLTNKLTKIENFDVTICDNFAKTTTVISNSSGDIVLLVTQKLNVFDALIGETSVAFLATRLAASMGIDNFLLERDALLVIVAVN